MGYTGLKRRRSKGLKAISVWQCMQFPMFPNNRVILLHYIPFTIMFTVFAYTYIH